MADTLTNPLINPILAQDQTYLRKVLQLQRNQQLAQTLQPMALSPIEYDPRGRVSPWQGVAKMANAYLAARLGKDNIDQQAELQSDQSRRMAELFAAPSQTGSPTIAGAQAAPGTQAPNATAPSSLGSVDPIKLANQLAPAPASDPTGMVGPGSGHDESPTQQARPVGQMWQPQPVQGLNLPAPNAAAQPTQAGMLAMPGMTGQQSYMAYLANPNAYMTELLHRSDNRTDLIKNMLSMGIDPKSDQGRSILSGVLSKETSIPVREGGGVLNTATGQVMTMPAKASQGFQNVQLANGQWATIPVQGGTEAITQSEAARAAGAAPYQVVDVYDPVAKAPVKAFAGNAMPLPPAPGAPQQNPPMAQAPAPNYQQAVPAPGSHPVISSSQQLQGIRESLPYLQQDLQRAQATGDPQAVAAAQRSLADAQTRLQQGTPWGAGGGRGAANPTPQNFAPQQGAGQPRQIGVQSGPGLGEAQGATNAQNEISRNWDAQMQAHSSANTNINLLQEIKGLSDQAQTGYEPARRQFLAKLGAFAGIPGMDERASSGDLLNKYSAQLVAGLASRGMGTDAARELVMSGTPNSHMQATAIREASDGLIARERMVQARTAALQSHALARNPQTYQATAAEFDRVADPRLWQMRQMSPDQLKGFTQRLQPQEAADLIQKYRAATSKGFLQ